MAVRFLLDEQSRGVLWQHLQKHNLLSPFKIEATRVGDVPDLPLGSQDADILEWCGRQDHVLITLDVNTMPAHWRDHLARNGRAPGVLLMRQNATRDEVVDLLATIANASESDEWRDRIEWIP